MPIVHIHKITQTLGNAISYGSRDKYSQELEEDDIEESINYAKDDKSGEIIFETLNSYLNCPSCGLDVVKDFEEIMEQHPRKRKVHEGETPALAYHIVQSFDGYVAPTLANQIGVEFADEFLKGYRVQISTHTNTDNIHNHIIFSCVNDRGERYNDCDTTMAQMRKVSDKICKSHGIVTLERTRDYKPMHFKGADGKQHSFEPTDRKIEMLRQRANGEITRDDISSYRNYDAYEKSNIEKLTQREIIRRDIEEYLPVASNYDHLIALLRENKGYEIKAYKKDDYDRQEPLAHVTFRHPKYHKGVRDSGIDGNKYIRKTLEAIIADNAGRKCIDLASVDESRRAWKKKEAAAFEEFAVSPENQDYTQEREKEIQDRLNALHFIEQYNVHDYKKISGIIEQLWSKYHAGLDKANEAREKIRRTETIIINFDSFKDKYTPEQIEKLKADVADWKERYQELSRQLAEQKSKLDEYEHSIGIIRDSARGGSEEFSDIWKEVDAVQERGKALASEKEIGAKTKVPHRKKDRER